MNKKLSRRDFLQVTALTVGALGASPTAISQVKSASVVLIADSSSDLISAPPVVWALQELETALTQHGINVQKIRTLDQAMAADFYINVAPANVPAVVRSGKAVSPKPESNALIPFNHKGKPAL